MVMKMGAAGTNRSPENAPNCPLPAVAALQQGIFIHCCGPARAMAELPSVAARQTGPCYPRRLTEPRPKGVVSAAACSDGRLCFSTERSEESALGAAPQQQIPRAKTGRSE